MRDGSVVSLVWWVLACARATGLYGLGLMCKSPACALCVQLDYNCCLLMDEKQFAALAVRSCCSQQVLLVCILVLCGSLGSASGWRRVVMHTYS